MEDVVLTEPDKFFWLRSGKGLRSIRELANALPSMPSEEFSYHGGPPRFDFSNWIEHVFGEKELAARLRTTANREEFQSILYNSVIHAEIHRKQEERAAKRASDEKAVIDDPARFVAFREEDTKRKDVLADRFDAVSRRFADEAHPETPKEVKRRIEAAGERYKDLHRRVAEARQMGKDPFIADLTLRSVPAKLEYARFSHDDRDFQQIGLILDDAERELAEALAFEEPDVKKEVAAIVARGRS